jgi:amino acid transporter
MVFTMVIATAVNVVGVRRASWTINVFTIAKLLPLALVIALGLFKVDQSILATQTVVEAKWSDVVLLLIFGYGGFESAVIVASESRDPKKDTAFALITAMLAITIIYCLAQIAVVGVLPNAAQSKAPIAETLARLIGPMGLKLGSIAVLISVYGWLTGFSLLSPRILYSMALRRELPQILGRVHHEFRTPYVAIILNSAVALALALASNFGQLATFGAIARLGIFIATCASLIALRKKHGSPSTFRLPTGGVFSSAGIVFCLWLLSTRDLGQAWFLPVVILVGIVIWVAMHRARDRAS